MNSICMPLREFFLNIKTGSLFGYIQKNFGVPDNLLEDAANFPPNFKFKNVGSG